MHAGAPVRSAVTSTEGGWGAGDHAALRACPVTCAAGRGRPGCGCSGGLRYPARPGRRWPADLSRARRAPLGAAGVMEAAAKAGSQRASGQTVPWGEVGRVVGGEERGDQCQLGHEASILRCLATSHGAAAGNSWGGGSPLLKASCAACRWDDYELVLAPGSPPYIEEKREGCQDPAGITPELPAPQARCFWLATRVLLLNYPTPCCNICCRRRSGRQQYLVPRSSRAPSTSAC